ncbi:hypothetical protein GBZ26_09500 [Azospirillum formosense]|uniref:Uncharacterized protein n=1 Tax=Azospirillum formosense TaxID=861533 RepID=A0ABX2KZ19_9PROT|nr:hypothetical protein [Azospirillum formosense]MBY3754968.1 hypothetical protein [Azospirillum formosense]NUB19445.1 hypothetical protein [Azospirillum formosense]
MAAKENSWTATRILGAIALGSAIMLCTAGNVSARNYASVGEMIMLCESHGGSDFVSFAQCYTANLREFMPGHANPTLQSIQDEMVAFTDALAAAVSQRRISSRTAKIIFQNARAKFNDIDKKSRSNPAQYNANDLRQTIYGEFNGVLKTYDEAKRLFAATSAEERRCVGDLDAYVQQDKVAALEGNVKECKRQIADRNAALARQEEARLAAEREKARQAEEEARRKMAQQEQLRQEEIARQKRAKEAYERCMADTECRTQKERAQAEWRSMVALGLYPKKTYIRIHGVRQQCESSGNFICMQICNQMADIVDRQVRAMTGTGILASTNLEFKLPGMEEVFAGALKQCIDVSRQ